jgi:uroporphyrinogen decarboxylase
MSTISKRERVDAALRGELLDRVPVAAWRHFIPDERHATTLASASLQFFHQYDWDWLKLNPRATYFAEAWGNQYDLAAYDGVLPRRVAGPIRTPDDLGRIARVGPTTGAFAEQLDLLRRVKTGIGDAHVLQTIFSPLSVLAFLTTEDGDQLPDLGLPSDFTRLRYFLTANPQGAHAALETIADTLGQFASANLAAGASGIFFAIVRLARVGVLSEQEYATWGRPYDLRLLEAVQGAPFNLLHVCGPQVYWNAVRDYPVHALNWAAVGQGNPSLAEARAQSDKVLVGGLDEHGALRHGTPAAVTHEAQTSILQAGRRGLLLAPGCGVDGEVPAANLAALRRAADTVRVASHA